MPISITFPVNSHNVRKNPKNKKQEKKSGKEINLLQKSALEKYYTASKYQKDYIKIIKQQTPAGKKQSNRAHQIAKEYVVYSNPKTKTALITYDHHYLALLEDILNFSLDIKSGEETYQDTIGTQIPEQLAERVDPSIWRKEKIDGIIKVVEKEIEQTKKRLEENSKINAPISSLKIEEELISDLKYLLKSLALTSEKKQENITLSNAIIISAMTIANNKDVRKICNDFLQKLSLEVMTRQNDEKSINLPYYSSVSNNIIRNLDKNFNIFVTYSQEDNQAPKYLRDNLISQIESGEGFINCKNLNKENTKFIMFNETARLSTIADAIKKISEDTDNHYVVFMEDYNRILNNSSIAQTEDGNLLNMVDINTVFKNKPKNVHYVLMNSRDIYYNYIANDEFCKENMPNFENLQIPIMDITNTKEQLRLTKDIIEQEIGMKITPEALDFVCDLGAEEEGSKYDTAMRFIKNIAAYYADENIITKEDIASYWENLQKNDQNTKENSYEIIFDTKTKIDDIIGSPMTKKQAQDAAYEIMNMPSTKGYVLFSANGEGGGRFKIAKAIAGEAQIPLVKISAMDFAIRDIDTINTDPIEAIDIKITKLVNLIKTQAQTNPKKTVILFISEFDRFASDPLYGISSVYEQQAFRKLQKEMKKAYADKSYNLVVMGSSDYPELTNENIIRPGLFMDSIVVYAPKVKDDILKIAKDEIEKKGYEIKGNTEEEKNKVLWHFANITIGFSYIDIVDILKKSHILSEKRNKNSIGIEEINEAFLQKVSGEVSDFNLDDKHKETIIRHEGGHALNLQFMYNLFKEKDDTLRIPDTIQNIVLDPRGDFLGCVYHSTADENTTETNLETVLSEIVCSFGGNSAEEHFYGMNGSWGISQDMKSANLYAKIAVTAMGLGANSKYYIPDKDQTGTVPVFAADEGKDYVEDVKIFLENGKTLSDKIVKCYDGFLREFSTNNIAKFGTGECIITGEEFAKSLKDWEKRQSESKKREIETLKKEALAIIYYTKIGKKYGILSKYNPIYRNN